MCKIHNIIYYINIFPEGGDLWLENVGGFMFIDDLFYSIYVHMMVCMIDYKAMENLVQCIAGTTVLGLQSLYLKNVLEVISFSLQAYITADRSIVIAGLVLFFQIVFSVKNVATHCNH